MKKVILLFSAVALLFVGCSEGEEVGTFGATDTIVGFSAKEYSVNFGTNLESSTLKVPVNLISYANEQFPNDVTMVWSVDATSTAVAGVDYALPASTSVTITNGTTTDNFEVTVYPIVFDPNAPKKLVLNMTTVSTDNAVIGDQYKQVTITLQGVCVSFLEGDYSTSTLRVNNGTIYTHALESFVYTDAAAGEYRNDYIGAYHSAGQTPGTSSLGGPTVELQGTSAGFAFADICGKLRVPTQNLASVYSNEVRQTEAQFQASNVNPETGVVTIYYSIWFTGNTVEREFISTYTPL
jgi:hypothetical protein